MSRKLIFLDVDGTLVDFTMHMPESAREALSIARKRGHLISLYRKNCNECVSMAFRIWI